MILPNPTDEALRRADVISLFDPSVPAWHQVVINTTRRTNVDVVDIPVDSTNEAEVQVWIDRIEQARRS